MGSLVVGHRGDLNLAVQAIALKRLMPAGSTKLTPGRLTWRGEIQPQSECDTYSVLLECRMGYTPTVLITAPELVPNDEGLLPHIYETGHLCVSRFGDWGPDMLVTETVLPWASAWLVFYELWRATGIWYGDGPDCLDAVSQAKILHPYV